MGRAPPLAEPWGSYSEKHTWKTQVTMRQVCCRCRAL